MVDITDNFLLCKLGMYTRAACLLPINRQEWEKLDRLSISTLDNLKN